MVTLEMIMPLERERTWIMSHGQIFGLGGVMWKEDEEPLPWRLQQEMTGEASAVVNNAATTGVKGFVL